uniref:Mediator complex subunit 15 KIX domain-containing protein n=1 Tax=Setaria italica TaxID=4555 RepID=K3YK80_SETIT
MDADWRSQLQPAARNRIVNKIMETLTKHIPVPPPLPEDLIELRKIAVRFEDKMYAAASSQSDYLRKIALKMLAVETYTKTQHNPGNAQVSPILKPSDPGTIHNTSYVALCAIYIFALFFFPYQENDYE